MPLDAYSQTVTEVAERLLPSVASVTVARGRRGATGGGSAVVLSDDGLLLTSAHVVEGVDRGGLGFADGAEVPFDVIGSDPLSDLAVLRAHVDGLRAAEFGDADELKVGQLVVAVGNPLGYAGSVSAGVVSGLRRSITTQHGQAVRLVEDVIQTDAALHPGNSGGALATADGSVVGVSTALVGPMVGQGLGLAVPINSSTRRIIEALRTDGRVTRLFLGVSGGPRPLPPKAAAEVGHDHGIEVLGVVRGSPASRAGIRPGDVLVTVDGEPVERVGQLQSLLTGTSPQSKVSVDLVRGGRRHRLQVALETLRT
jgi:S1-C subfamily serine protease